MRFEFAMQGSCTCFGDYKMLRALFQLAIVSATTAVTIACGNVLHGAGSISSPNYPSNYPNGVLCEWTLMATEGRFVSLRIVDFHLESNYDYVYIYKDTQKSTLSHKFTGSGLDNAERLILSSTITIKFTSDNTYTDLGFRMEFESISAANFTACGGEIQESGYITSPNYPQQYPNNSHCTWTLTTTSDRLMLLQLISLDAESGYDYLQIYNGRVASKQLLRYNLTGVYSKDRKTVFYGEAVTIVFTSDNTYSKRGFLIEYRSFDTTPYAECGGELTGSGIIITPSFPNNYTNNTRCQWKITAGEDQDVYIRLLEFNTELNYDFLHYSYVDDETYSIYRYTGSYSNKLLPIASGRTIYLIFTSDGSNSDSGFRVEFKTVYTKCPTASFCGGELQGSGNITFSEKECSKVNCTWTLTATPDHVISIQISDMSTDDGYLYIYNETKLTDVYAYFLYTGSNWRSGQPILLGPSCQVVFIRTLSSAFFEIEFKSIPKNLHPACGGEFIGSGRITSSNVLNQFPYYTHCIWKLTSMADQKINVQIAGFSSVQQQASLHVLNGRTPRNSYLLYPYQTSYKEKEKLILPGPNALVVLYGNFTRLDSTFEVLFESINLTTYTACGGVMNGSGEIVSPNYPNNYPNNCRCTWRLRATAGLSVALQLTAIRKEINYDYIKVYSLTGQNETYLELFSDYPLRSSLTYIEFYTNNVRDSTGLLFNTLVDFWRKPTTFGSNAVLSFNSDSTISDSGFKIEFTSINTTVYKECGGKLQDSGNITSPNYPQHYPNNSLCTWQLKATSGSIISLRFVEFNTERGYDYLFFTASSYVYWGDGEFFTGVIPTPYDKKPIDFGEQGTVIFISDRTNSAAGFRIEFTSIHVTQFTDCGEKLYGSGDLASPNYPHDYNNKSLCTWKLIAEAGRSVLLHILEFNTEKDYDYIAIFNETPSESMNTFRFSGSYNTTPRIVKVLVPGTYATIEFRSDISISGMGFRIQFLSADVVEYTGCGGELRGSGIITSPNYPANYPNNSRCTWTLRADDGHIVSLRLLKFNTEYDYDLVSIYNESLPTSSNSSYNYTGYFAEGAESIALAASATVVFTSDISESASGFQIEFKSIYATNKEEVVTTTTALPDRKSSRCKKTRRNNTELILPADSDKK